MLSNLKIDNDDVMKELIELIYLKSNIQRVILTINNKNIEKLSELLSKFINEYSNKYSFEDKKILCNESPYK